MRWFADQAWLPDGLTTDVLIEADAGRFISVRSGVDFATVPGASRLPGLVLPGFANAHSHAFHRALRGRTHDDRGTFWTWRKRMYAVAAVLTPEQYLSLATAAYAEMALSGVTAVGEFHYLHHAPGGRHYNDPNEMSEALRAAARSAGIRLTLLDTCYLAGGLTGSGHLPLDEVQLRFADEDAEHWLGRTARLVPDDHLLIGSAVHSVRAVPGTELARVAADRPPGPVHVHLSEQPAENEACLAFYGRTPTQLLQDEGLLGPELTAVHATHLRERDIEILATSGCGVCFCPTTERDLADGIGPAAELADAGVVLSLGSDQHAVTDLLEEARALAMHDRLVTLQRGRFGQPQLIQALTGAGQSAIGWQDAGRIEVGARADLVAVRLDSVRTAGSAAEQVLFAASAADVSTVVADGVPIVVDGNHRLGDVGQLLRAAIEPLWAGR